MKIIMSLVLVTLNLAVLRAEDAPLEYHLTHSFVSKYLATVGSVISDQLSFVNDVTISRGNYYVGIWNATGLDHGVYGKTYKDEWDPYVGWGFQNGSIRYEIAAVYFLIADFSRSNDDLWVIDQTLKFRSIPGITPYLKIRDFNRVGTHSPGGGWFLWVGVNRIQPIGQLKFDIDLSAAYSDGPLGKDPGSVFYRLTNSLHIPVSKSITVTPTLYYQVPTRFQGKALHSFVKGTEFVWGISASYAIGTRK